MLSESRQWDMMKRLAMESRLHFVLTSQTSEISSRFSGSSRQPPRPTPAGNLPAAARIHRP
jgi:hypothetical protein